MINVLTAEDVQKNVRRKLSANSTMNGKFVERLKKAAQLLGKDIRNYDIGFFMIILYFLIMRKWFYSSCPMVVLTGFPCPGCGMTRAMILILKGSFAGAWRLHPFSYAWLVYGVVFFARRYILQKECRSILKCFLIIVVGMVVFYVYRMATVFPDEAPMTYYYGSILYRILKLFN